MSVIIGWRTDIECFEVGSEMRPRGDPLDSMNEANYAAETYLREWSEEAQHVRADSLYAWRDRSWAEFTRTYGNLEKAKFLYRLEINTNEICHLGDVGIYTQIRDALDQGLDASELRERYWTGKAPPGQARDKFEILAKRAIVLERLEPIRT